MSKFFVTLFILFFSIFSYCQKLSQISFLDGARLSFFSISTDQGVLIRLSEEGKLLEWGTEVLSERYRYYASKLQPFDIRTEYYETDDSAIKGKLKSIGTCFITYYGAYEEETKRGKIKSMGPLQFDYYSTYEEKSLRGKLKLIGNLLLEYYRPYENESYRGKLKSVGSVAIIYYTAFDDRYNAGKLKSIGPVPIAWYSEYDQSRGSLKSNNYRQFISGVTYILR